MVRDLLKAGVSAAARDPTEGGETGLEIAASLGFHRKAALLLPLSPNTGADRWMVIVMRLTFRRVPPLLAPRPLPWSSHPVIALLGGSGV